MKDWVFRPLLFQALDGKPLGQIFLTCKIGMKRTAEKGFSEATGTAEKYIFVLLGHPIDECCFVYINALSCDEVAESLYSHRINSFHHGLCFFSLWQSYEKFLSIERIKRKRFLREIG